MRIAVIDDSAARAQVIAAGLHEAGLQDVHVFLERHGVAAKLEVTAPDVVLINLENPSRDVLEESFALSRVLARPIAMFVDQSDEQAIAEAVDAGISAYVVDGLRKDRIKPILDLAVRRFHAFAKLQAELNEARGQIAERRTIDQAKLLLMRRRGLDEPAAYKLLRSHAMRSNRRIVEVAEALLVAENLLGEAL
ncbi:MAG: ANTAR domain-containing protein [Sphingomonadales bacterium]|nr:MAG: ANTAR domain-containing protein [Sphingomonadales bacterium]